jgi:ferrous iron transport protein B
LIGNPNVGKSVIFNNLTGFRQHTGNWPGKTVEKKEGYYTYKDIEFEIVDLPGVYSLSARSEDERVAREYLIDYRPDVVVDVVNAAQLERNLYLTLLLIEFQVNLVVALNMHDVVKSKGDSIDIEKLSEHLAAPVVCTIATKKEGMTDLKEAVLKATPKGLLTGKIPNGRVGPHEPGEVDGGDHLHYHPRHHHHGEFEYLRPPPIKYSQKVESCLKRITGLLADDKELLDRYPPRWLAIRLLERDEEMLSYIRNPKLREKIMEVAPC